VQNNVVDALLLNPFDGLNACTFTDRQHTDYRCNPENNTKHREQGTESMML
jgi:hypothetical protein